MTSSPTPLTRFRFEANLPADPDFLDPLGALVRHALVYVGLDGTEVEATSAGVVALAAGPGGPGDRIAIRFDREDEELAIRLSGRHLPATPPGALASEVEVSREGRQTVYRVVRRLPASRASGS